MIGLGVCIRQGQPLQSLENAKTCSIFECRASETGRQVALPSISGEYRGWESADKYLGWVLRTGCPACKCRGRQSGFVGGSDSLHFQGPCMYLCTGKMACRKVSTCACLLANLDLPHHLRKSQAAACGSGLALVGLSPSLLSNHQSNCMQVSGGGRQPRGLRSHIL